MWKAVLAGILSLCVAVPSALAQSSQYPQVRNDSNVRWSFGVVCGSSSVTVVLEPNRRAAIDPSFAQPGCTLFGGSAKAGGGFNSGNMPGSFNVNALCGVTHTGAAYCTNAVVALNLQVARVDKPVTVLIDGTPFSAGAIASPGGLNRQLLAGQHTVTLIGTGRGTFDISLLWALPNGALTTVSLIKGQSPNGVGGDTWMVSQTLQLDPMIR